MRHRETLLTAVVLLAVFLAGALVGAAVASTLGASDRARAEASGPGTPVERGDGERPDDRVRRSDRDGDRRRGPDYAVSRILHEELDLDAGQERSVEAVLERRRGRAHEIFDRTKARLRSQFDSTIEELEEVLTEEQAARFDTLLEQLKEKRGWGEDADADDSDGPDAPPQPDRRPED